MRFMRIMKNLQNFLYDQDYYIDIFNNCLHVYYYQELLSLSDEYIELKLKEFILNIKSKINNISILHQIIFAL